MKNRRATSRSSKHYEFNDIEGNYRVSWAERGKQYPKTVRYSAKPATDERESDKFPGKN